MKIVENTLALSTSGDNKLTIKIGNGQIGHSSLMKQSGDFVTGEVVNEPLGSNISNYSIIVSTMVTDVNPHTNNTNISILINNVTIDTFSTTTNEDNGQVLYSTQLDF